MTREKGGAFQEQLIRARQEQILQSATRVFAQKGFARATIRDVARDANISEGTIYNYFENKTALLLAILNRLNESERREKDLAQGASQDFRAFFRHYLSQRLSVMTQDGAQLMQVILSEVLINAELRALYVEQVITPTFTLAEPYFARLIQEGKIREVDIPLTLRAIAASFLGLLTLRILGDPQLQTRWEELPDVLCSLFLDGLAPGR